MTLNFFYPNEHRERRAWTETGWAPCAHSNEKLAELTSEYLTAENVDTLLWKINMLGATPEVIVDQWWMIIASGYIAHMTPYRTAIQGDSLKLAATETLKRWEKQYEHINGKPFDWDDF